MCIFYFYFLLYPSYPPASNLKFGRMNILNRFEFSFRFFSFLIANSFVIMKLHFCSVASRCLYGFMSPVTLVPRYLYDLIIGKFLYYSGNLEGLVIFESGSIPLFPWFIFILSSGHHSSSIVIAESTSFELFARIKMSSAYRTLKILLLFSFLISYWDIMLNNRGELANPWGTP